ATEVTFSDVFVRGKRNAVTVGTRGTILYTTNSGREWQRARLEVKDHLYGVTFAADNDFKTGWAVGTYGRLLKTTDGGVSWNVLKPATERHILKISAYDENRVAAAGVNGTV